MKPLLVLVALLLLAALVPIVVASRMGGQSDWDPYSVTGI